MELRTIERVYQGTCGNWAYRFRQTDKGVIARRVPIDDRLWSHGTVCQMFDLDTNTYRPSIQCGTNVYLANIDRAHETVDQ